MIGLCLKYEQINYGSKLQALATLRVLEELGQECKVIHYGKAGLWFKIKSLPRIFDATFRQDKLEDWSRSHAYKKHPEVAPLLAQRKSSSKNMMPSILISMKSLAHIILTFRKWHQNLMQ